MNNFPSPFTIYRNTFTYIHAVTKKWAYHLTTSIPMKKEQNIFIWLDHYFLLGWQTERKTKCVLIIFTRLEQSWLFAWMKCLNNTVLRRKKRKKKRERNHHLSKYVPDKLFFGKIVMPIPNRSLWICNNVSSAGVVVWSRTT